MLYQGNLLSKTLVIGIIFLFVVMSIIPSMAIVSVNINISSGKSSVNDIDWWPMFKHDSQNTGYSSSKTAPSTNMIRWTVETEFYVIHTPVVVEGKVYCGGSGLQCLDADTGLLIWSSTSPSTSPCVVDGKVYYGTGYKYLCLDAETGELIWNFYTEYKSRRNPVVADGKVFISSDYKKNISIYCLDAYTGDIIWDYFYEDWGVSSPAVYNGKLYIGHTYGCYDCGILLCFDADTGEILWNFTTGYFVMSSPSISNGKVYSGGNGLHCLDAETGEELWTFPAPDGNTSNSPTIAYGRVYYLGRYGKIFCLDAETGEDLWNYKVSNVEELSIYSTAVADGKLYASVWSSGKLLCLDAYTGEFIWSKHISGGSPAHLFSSPAIAEGRIYIGSFYDRKIYCFQDNSGPPSAPMIDGPFSGKPGIEYEYTFNSIEPDRDDVYYFIDWGDGNDSGWIGPYQPELDTIVSNIWLESGLYIIRAKARDIFNSESNWSEFEVEIPRTRATVNSLFQLFLDRFPFLEVFLRAMNLLR